jgi:hypothetical protein
MDKQFGGLHLFQKENVYIIHMNDGENVFNPESLGNLHKALDAVEGY